MEGTPCLLQRRPQQQRNGRAPPVGRRSRTTRTTPSNYVRTTLLVGAHSSSRLLVASVPRLLCYMNHSAAELPKPHPSGAHSSSPLWVASVPRQLVAWTTPQRNCSSPTRQTCSLRAQPACCTAHLRELPQHKPQDRPSTCTCFCASGLRHMHDASRTRILESTVRWTSDVDFACSESPSACVHLCWRSQTDLRGPPLDYGHRAVGAHVGAPSLWSSLGRNGRCSWNVWAFSFGDFFQYARYRMSFSTYVHPSCASNKLLCFLSAEI